MDRIVFTNSRNESIEFSSHPPYKLMSIDGLGGLDNNISTEKSPFQHGDTYLNSSLEVRKLMFDVLIMANDLSDIKIKRSNISKVLNPTLGLGTLKYIFTDGEIKSVKCSISTSPVFVNSPKYPAERFQVTQFTLYCHSPFWEDEQEYISEMEAFVNLFEFPIEFSKDEEIEMGMEGNEIIINNVGDVLTPVKITFTGACVNPVIKNVTNNEFIKINYELKDHDVLTINTEFGNKRIEINGVNAYSYITLDSTLWELAVGENFISYETDAGAENAKVLIAYKNRYVGI